MKPILFLLLLFPYFSQAFADYHCRFEPQGVPISYLRWIPDEKVVWTLSDLQQWHSYQDVQVATGLPPYPLEGFTLLAFGEVLMIKIRPVAQAVLPTDSRQVTYRIEAYWGKIPGTPVRQPVNGVCWTDAQGPNLLGNW